MKTIEDVQAAVTDFERRAGVLIPRPLEPLAADSLRTPRTIMQQPWAKHAGVYVLMHGPAVEYVGRALMGQGLGKRLTHHLRVNRVCREAANPTDAVPIIVLPLVDDDNNAWLAPSLELLVLHWVRWDGLLNKKRS